MTTVEVTETDRPVRIAAGDVMVLRLPENPTTGFVWSVAVSEPARLAVEASEARRRDPPLPGAASEREFRLRGQAGSPGPVRVTLTRSRPWESVPQEVRTLEVHVE